MSEKAQADPEAGRVFILDELVAKPGMAADCREAYRNFYVPGAGQRGMRLEAGWQSPAGQDYDELPTTLYWLWSVADAKSWWAMRMSRGPDGSDDRFRKLESWEKIEPLLIERKRSVLTRQPEEG